MKLFSSRYLRSRLEYLLDSSRKLALLPPTNLPDDFIRM